MTDPLNIPIYQSGRTPILASDLNTMREVHREFQEMWLDPPLYWIRAGANRGIGIDPTAFQNLISIPFKLFRDKDVTTNPLDVVIGRNRQAEYYQMRDTITVGQDSLEKVAPESVTVQAAPEGYVGYEITTGPLAATFVDFETYPAQETGKIKVVIGKYILNSELTAVNRVIQYWFGDIFIAGTGGGGQTLLLTKAKISGTRYNCEVYGNGPSNPKTADAVVDFINISNGSVIESDNWFFGQVLSDSADYICTDAPTWQ